jgi:hypothetical protein
MTVSPVTMSEVRSVEYVLDEAKRIVTSIEGRLILGAVRAVFNLIARDRGWR